MKIYENLCVYDPRSPDHSRMVGLFKDAIPDPREPHCTCDPCAYGRDSLAVQIIEVMEALKEGGWIKNVKGDA